MSNDFPTDLEIYQILTFLNSVKSIEEITSAFSGADIKVRPDFLDLKAKVGQFNAVDQICNVLGVYHNEISGLVKMLRDKGIVK